MILPTKHTPESKSLLGFGVKVLSSLNSPKTFNELWLGVRERETSLSYSHFVLALDFLYIIGAVDYKSGRITRCNDA